MGRAASLKGIHAGSPFIAVPIQSGNGGAYYIAVDAGTFGPVFDNTASGWNASTAAFR